jgi:hypothetical protein
MSPLLLAWYKSNIEKDAAEQSEQNIAIAEYLASFTNPRGVEQVRSSRAKSKRVTDDSMLKTLRAISGKHLTDEQIRKNLAQK